MDKRKSIREFTASDIEIYDLKGEFICTATVNDISKGGILVALYDTEKFDLFSRGQKIKFQLTVPTGPIAGSAEVSWADNGEARMGLKFTRIENEEGVTNLMAFVAGGFI